MHRLTWIDETDSAVTISRLFEGSELLAEVTLSHAGTLPNISRVQVHPDTALVLFDIVAEHTGAQRLPPSVRERLFGRLKKQIKDRLNESRRARIQFENSVQSGIMVCERFPRVNNGSVEVWLQL